MPTMDFGIHPGMLRAAEVPLVLPCASSTESFTMIARAKTPDVLREGVQRLAEHFHAKLTGKADGHQIQFYMRAICHDDQDATALAVGTHDTTSGQQSNDGYPLIYCHRGCNYPTIRSALTAAGADPELLRPAHGQPEPPVRSGPHPRTVQAHSAPPPVIADRVWVRYHDSLMGKQHRDKLDYLNEEKGIDRDTIRAMLLGWDERRGRYSIPIFDAEGRCVNIRLFRPHVKTKKIINYSVTGSGLSYGQNRLYIPGDDLDPGERTIHCAGEMDAIRGWQEGWQTSTQTGGESSHFPAIDAWRMHGQHVVVAYDNDDTGRKGADSTGRDLAPLTRSLHVADLSVLDLPDKGDVGDILRRPDLGSDALRAIVADATMWAAGSVDQIRGLRPVDWQEFWTEEPVAIRYLVEPMFAAGEITRVFAQAKVGKSLLVMECMAALASGRAVLGQTPEPADVLYIDQENTSDDWRDRLTSMGYSGADDLRRLHWYSLQSWPALDTGAGGDQVLSKVREHGAVIVVIDTQSKVLDGPEDKADTAGAFYRHTLLPLKREGCAVVIIDHAGNDPTRPRGSSGKRDDVDVVWQLSTRARDRLTAKRTHSRKRHSLNLLLLNRLTQPTRHEAATDDQLVEREEELLEACTAAILALDPRPPSTTSGRDVIVAVRAASKSNKTKSFREATIQRAWKRLKEILREQDA